MSTSSLEVLQDESWHWVPEAPENLRPNESNLIVVEVCPTEPGYRPKEQRDRLELEFYPEAPIQYLEGDINATFGHLHHLGERALATVTDWPSPEFFGNLDESALFIRLWTQRELVVGHFHYPFGVVFTEGVFRQMSLSRQK
ncbi:MAG TPA: hypothetical protein VMR34_01865 [Candidatus Saccharimonadales bacterium]|nr:hypothetical protein [Candidatus Saccharimonadales bacterium]